MVIATGCGKDEEYSLRDDLINGVWVVIEEIDVDYNAVDFKEGGSVVLYEGQNDMDNCIQEDQSGLFVLEGNELTLSGVSVLVQVSEDVLTVDEDGTIYTYDRYTNIEFETLLSSFCQ